MANVEDVVREAARAVRERYPHLEIQISRRGAPSAQPADERTVTAFNAVFEVLAQTARAVALSVEASSAGALITLYAGGAPAATWDAVGRIVREGGGRVAIRKNANGATAFVFWDARGAAAVKHAV